VVNNPVEPDFTPFAHGAGTTLVALMTTEAWQHLRERFTQLWHRFQPHRAGTLAVELAADQEEAMAAARAGDEATLDELRAQWRGRLRRLLVAEPSAYPALRSLLDEFAPPDAPGAPHIVQHASATGHARVYQAGRDQHSTER
jgi:hypothetical protein